MYLVIISWILTSISVTCSANTWNIEMVKPPTPKPVTIPARFDTYNPSSTSTAPPKPSSSAETDQTVDGLSQSRTDESTVKIFSSTTDGLLETDENETHQEEKALENWEFFESLTLVDFRYVGIVVEVKDDVEEDPALIDNLKELLKNASAALQVATESTDGRYSGLQFGEVTIIVPHHWDLEAPVLQVRGPSPAVIVSEPNPRWGYLPYTLQPGGCGEEGLYIHLTPAYIEHMNSSNTLLKLGAAGSVFLHEWAHYRWGVFDEYVDPSHNPSALRGERPFYLDEDLRVRASVCPSTSKGWIVREVNGSSSTANLKSALNDSNQVPSVIGSESLEVCTSRDNDSLPPDDCFFYPASELDDHASSIMGSVAEGQNANAFCGGGAVQHNFEAPTPHNIMCGGRSVWDVMLDHKDFANRCGNFRQKRATKDFEPPKFRIRKRLYFTSIILLLECDSNWMPKLQAVRDEILLLNDTLGSASSDLKVVLVSASNSAKIVPMNSNGNINSRSQRSLSSTSSVNSVGRSRETLNLHGSETFEPTQNVWEDLQCGAHYPHIESTLKAEAGTKGAMVVVFHTPEGNLADVQAQHPGRIFSLSLADGCSDKRCREAATEDLVGAFRSLVDAHPLALRRPTNKQMNEGGLNGRNRRLNGFNRDTKMRPNTRYTTQHEGLTHDDMNVQFHAMHTENKAPNDLGSVRLSHRRHQARNLSLGKTGVKKLMSSRKLLMKRSKINHSLTVSETVSLDYCFGSTVVVLRAPRGVARFGFSLSKSNVGIAPLPLKRKTYGRIQAFQVPCSESYGELAFKVWMNDTQELEKRTSYTPIQQPEEVSVSFYQAADERLAVRLSIHVFVKNADTRRCPDEDASLNTEATMTSTDSVLTPSATSNEPSLQRTPSLLHSTSHTPSPPPPSTGSKHEGLRTPKSQFKTTTLQPPTTPTSSPLQFNGTKMTEPSQTVSFEQPVSPAGEVLSSSAPKTMIEDSVPSEYNEIKPSRQRRAEDKKRPQYSPKQIRHGSQVRIVSLLTTGAGEPVLHATVEAVVRGPHNFSAVVKLRDDGVGADTVAGDGAYSEFLTVIHGNGKHSIDVRASGGPSATRVISSSLNYDRFWDTSETPKQERERTQLYDLRVQCAERALHNQLVSARFLSDSGEETHLVDLRADSAESGEGALYSGSAHILSSGKIVVPANCILVSALRRGPPTTSFERLEMMSSSFASRGSAAKILPRTRNPEEQFHVKPSASFPSAAPAGSPVPKYNPSSDVEDFRIVAAAADFKRSELVKVKVVKYSPRDLTPPGRVKDLKAALVHYITPAVVLQWTSAGDDYFSGTASSLELRYHAKQSVLQREFDRATLVEEGVQVAQGTLVPMEAMVVQNVTVFLKEEVSLYDLTHDQVFYFALILTDEMGNRGRLSNLADARFTIKNKTQEIQAMKSSHTRSVATMSIMGVLFVVVLLVVGYVKIKQYVRHRKLRYSNDVSLDLTSDYYLKYGTHSRNANSNSNQGTYPRNTPKHGQRCGSVQRASPKLSNDLKV